MPGPDGDRASTGRTVARGVLLMLFALGAAAFAGVGSFAILDSCAWHPGCTADDLSGRLILSVWVLGPIVAGVAGVVASTAQRSRRRSTRTVFLSAMVAIAVIAVGGFLAGFAIAGP